jgi:hypothetical protein
MIILYTVGSLLEVERTFTLFWKVEARATDFSPHLINLLPAFLPRQELLDPEGLQLSIEALVMKAIHHMIFSWGSTAQQKDLSWLFSKYYFFPFAFLPVRKFQGPTGPV